MLQPLNEMYFGKVANLLKLEELIEKLKIKYRREDIFDDPQTFKMLTKDPILNQISNTIAVMFGFEEVVVTFNNSRGLGAYTITFPRQYDGAVYDVNDNRIDIKKVRSSVIITNRGFTFDKRKLPTNILICFTTGIVFNNNISSPELISVLLHELGHSFAMVTLGPDNFTDRVDEKFADQFVAMYGYGPEFVTIFSKFSIDRGNYGKNSVVNLILGLKNLVKETVARQMEYVPHPSTKSRMESQIRQLESDLRNTPHLTPKIKRDIQSQIDMCKRKMIEFFDGDSNTMVEKMIKFYDNKISYNLSIEKKRENNANAITHPDTVNRKMKELYFNKNKRR